MKINNKCEEKLKRRTDSVINNWGTLKSVSNKKKIRHTVCPPNELTNTNTANHIESLSGQDKLARSGVWERGKDLVAQGREGPHTSQTITTHAQLTKNN